ncbi:phage late control D family protein [Streptomyces coeruleoprunus]|uniref:Phage late control D family protein n=1 Tax=Streptomyces coeruleoprunus TaxID=285563 RepID=A0ABV9XAL4_9ACTN
MIRIPDKVFELRCGGSPAADLYPYVEYVEVDESVDGSSFTIRLRLSAGPDGEWNHLSDERFTPFARLGVSLGFTGGGLAGAPTAAGGLLSPGGSGPEPLAEGYVIGTALRLSGRDAHLDVFCQDPWAVLGQEEKVVAWPDLSDSDIAEQILTAAGFAADVTTVPPLRQSDDTLVVQRGTDASFLRALARRNGFEVRFVPEGDGNRCRFGPPGLDGTPQPDLAIRFGATSNLRSFEATLDGRRPLSVRAAQLVPGTRQEATVEVGEPAHHRTGRTGLAALTADTLARAARPLRTPGALLLTATPTADPSELQQQAQAARDEAAWFVEAAGEINSDAYGHVLRAGRSVLVKGAGSLHSGAYYVTRVVHRMRPEGEYRQRFEARRNAVGLEGSESFGGGAPGLSLPGL